MRGLLPLPLVLAFFPGTPLTAQDDPAADPYSNEPYWYQPGHPVDPADAAAIETQEGFVAERIFTVPREWGSWTALGIDPQGRLLAAAQHEPGIYRLTLPKSGEPEAAVKVEKLRGAAAKLGWAHGLLAAHDSLYVTVSEENDAGVRSGVYRLTDTDGDDEYDTSVLLLALAGTGEHGPHNLSLDADGHSLLWMIGNGTPVPDGLDRRLTPRTAGVDHVMPPGFASSEYSAQGWVLRMGPDGSNPEVLCTGLRNAFQIAVHPTGERFTFDSDAEWDLGTPWYRPTRIVHLVSGGEYGWRADAAVWPEYFADAVPTILNIGPGSPTGVIFGYGTAFPARYQHALFALDWTFATVHAVFLEPDGASFRAHSEVFLGGTGLPVTHVVVGQDGALYLNVGGRRLNSAIYRVRYIGSEPTHPVQPPRLTEFHQLRGELERYHGTSNPRALEAVWPYLKHPDPAIRYAARVAVEAQPVDSWRDQALAEITPLGRLTAWLALARQGSAADLARILRALEETAWSELAAEEQLRALRIIELILARAPAMASAAGSLRSSLAPLFPSKDLRVTRELSRLLCLLGDTDSFPRLLEVMQTDRGQSQRLGMEYFARNPKYGQAVGDMLQAAPLAERMHHAQMALWLLDRGTTEQHQTYFELTRDALARSRGGHQYSEFWIRIQEEALKRVPAAERAQLATLRGSSGAGEADPLPQPAGPGRAWTTADVLELTTGGLRGRNPERGETMFRAAACATCHRFRGNGGSLGPDLTAVGQRFTFRDLVEAIVEPSRAVSDQYRMVLLTTTEGETLSGRILSRDSEYTRLVTNPLRPSESISVANARITAQQVVPISTMPAGLLDRLNVDEVRDLLAFLVSGGDPGREVFQAP